MWRGKRERERKEGKEEDERWTREGKEADSFGYSDYHRFNAKYPIRATGEQ